MNKVPDLGGSDAASDDRAGKRRRSMDDGNDSDEDMKRARTQDSTGPSGGGGRGRGRGQGSGRGARGNRAAERESAHFDKCEDDPDTSPQQEESQQGITSETIPGRFKPTQSGETTASNAEDAAAVRNFDLNLELDENDDTTTATEQEMKALDDYPGWSDNMAQMITQDDYPVQLALLNGRLDEEEEEDYDNADD